jgi:hypothetical protein
MKRFTYITVFITIVALAAWGVWQNSKKDAPYIQAVSASIVGKTLVFKDENKSVSSEVIPAEISMSAVINGKETNVDSFLTPYFTRYTNRVKFGFRMENISQEVASGLQSITFKINSTQKLSQMGSYAVGYWLPPKPGPRAIEAFQYDFADIIKTFGSIKYTINTGEDFASITFDLKEMKFTEGQTIDFDPVVQTGSTLTYTNATLGSGNTGSTGNVITVPTCDIAIVLFGGWAATNDMWSGGVHTLGGEVLTKALDFDDDYSFHLGGVFYKINPTTGSSKALSYDLLGSGTLTTGANAILTFWSGVDTSSFRDTDVLGNSAFGTPRTLTSTVLTGDKVLAFATFTSPTTHTWTGPAELSYITGLNNSITMATADISSGTTYDSTFSIDSGDRDGYFGALVLKPSEASPPPPSVSDLVGWWTFDGQDISGATAFDKSSNSNNGTITGATPTIGRLGQALKFNGVNNYVSSDFVTNSVNFTYSAWIKLNNLDKEQHIVELSSTQFYLNADNKIHFGIGASSDTVLQKGVWYFATVTRTSSGSQIYINGVSDGSVGAAGPGPSEDPTYIGRYYALSNYFFDGIIDDVRIYNRALSADEIRKLYKSGQATLKQGPTNGGLVGHWKFDEGSGTSAGDSSGNSNTGTITGATWTNGKLGKALSFNGSSDFISIPDNPSLHSTEGTVSVWFKGTTDSDVGIFGVQNAAGSYFWDLELNSDGCIVAIFTNQGSGYSILCHTNTNRNILFDGNWHNIVVTVDTDHHLYIDGISLPLTGSNNYFTSPAQNIYWTIGAETDGTTPYIFTKGSLDDVRIYNRALSPAEVLKLYNEGATKINSSQVSKGGSLVNGLVGYWTFDGKDISGINAYDRSPAAANTGTIVGATTAIGKLGQALKFNGTSDYVYKDSPTGVSTGSGASWSLAAWVKTDVLDSSNRLIVYYGGVADSHIPHISLSANNKWRVSTWGLGNDVDANSPSPQIGVWTHLVGIGSGSNVSLYVNGALAVGPTAVTNDPTDTFLVIGGNVSTMSFDGSIDDVRIYNRALSASEIKELYGLGQTVIRK